MNINYKNYRVELGLVLLSISVSVVASVYFYSQGVTLANGDAVAHLNMSRRIVDSLTPGLAQLGYVWLPINHLLTLPFVWIDSLYYTGLAGTFVSMFAFVLSCFYVYRLTALATGIRLAGVVAFLLFCFNPNVLYLQSTPLTEVFYICTLLGAIYYLLLWFRTKKVVYLIISSVFMFAGSLSRYDGWAIALGIFMFIFLYGLYMHRGWAKTEASAIIFGLIAFLGPVSWLAWNWIIFGNPLYFAVGKYSAKFQQLDLLTHGQLPSYHNLSNSILYIFYSGQLVLGRTLVLAGGLGIIYYVYKIFKTRNFYKLIVFILGLQILYYVLNVYAGNGVVFVPELPPYKMFNIRYAVTFIPLFVVCAGWLAGARKFLALVIVVLVLGEYAYVFSTRQVITVNESVSGYASLESNASRIAVGKWLEKNYTGGLILGDTFVNDTTAFYSRTSLKKWIVTGNTEVYNKAITNPAEVVDWILVRDGDEISRAMSPEFLRTSNFGVVYTYEDIKVYKKFALPRLVELKPDSVQTGPEMIPVLVPSRHVVVPGETLWSIARLYLGEGRRWPEIVELNKLASPASIQPGLVLAIPK